MKPFRLNFYHFIDLESFMNKNSRVFLNENKMNIILPLTINKLIIYEKETI